MGCGASKEDIAEPRSMRSHGRNKLHLKDKEVVALKPNENICALDGSVCICSLYNNVTPSAELSIPPSPPSVLIHTPNESMSSDEDEDEDDEDDDDDDDFDPSFEFPKKLSLVEEDNNNASKTTALAALSGGKTASDKELEERVEAILATDDEELLFQEQSEQCCALGVLSQSAVLQALLSTAPVITHEILGSDLSSARVGHVAVISGPEPIRWETPMRKAEIIDLDLQGVKEVSRTPCLAFSGTLGNGAVVIDVGLRRKNSASALLQEEHNAGESLILENTPEQQENQSEQEPAGDHALKQKKGCIASLTEEEKLQRYPKPQLSDDANMHKTLSGPEPRKGKLPPLSIIPPILVELPADPFAKPAFPIVIKKDLMDVKVPGTEQFEDLSADRTPPMALELADSPNESNHEDKRSKSSLVTEHCEDGTPTPATKSSADSGWRSPHRDLPDPDIENIVLLESQEELNGQLPLISMLDCHSIHMKKQDLISPSMRLIS